MNQGTQKLAWSFLRHEINNANNAIFCLEKFPYGATTYFP